MARKDWTTAPTIADFEAIAEEAMATIPDFLRDHVKGVVIQVDDFPDQDTMDAMELETPFDILGLYRGVGLPFKSALDTPDDLDMIYLYRRPILDYWCDSDETLPHLIRHVLIHEIGHHIGFSDEDMDDLETGD